MILSVHFQASETQIKQTNNSIIISWNIDTKVKEIPIKLKLFSYDSYLEKTYDSMCR